MIAIGVIQEWHNEYFKIERDPRKYVEEVEPQVLDLQMLRFGFLAFLISLSLSTFVFAIEMFIKGAKYLAATVTAFYIAKACPLEKFF